MDSRTAGAALLLALMVAPTAKSEDSDLVAGENLYVSQCKICHGSASAQTSDLAPTALRRRLVHVAMLEFAGPMIRDMNSVLTTGTLSGESVVQAERIAFAPPFGPNLRGVYGRAAGSVQGFEYSAPFLKSLKGMEWNEAALDVWISSPQAWVPGVYMFYKQSDPEIRRKIILYLKANR